VLVKAINPKKLDVLYCGPYEVMDVDVFGERVCVSFEGGKHVWQNIKNIKPFWGGDDVMVTNPITPHFPSKSI
jgi:hypothetical protein